MKAHLLIPALCATSFAACGTEPVCSPAAHCHYSNEGPACDAGYVWLDALDPDNLACIRDPNTPATLDICGDGTCSAREGRWTCPEDCERCGDGTCGPTESTSTCLTDCGSSYSSGTQSCPLGESMCGTSCIPSHYECCDDFAGVYCRDGSCHADAGSEHGFVCRCPAGESVCDGGTDAWFCVDSSYDCCDSGEGLYCESGECRPSAIAEEGYACFSGGSGGGGSGGGCDSECLSLCGGNWACTQGCC